MGRQKDFAKMSRNEKVKYFSNLEHNAVVPKAALDKCKTKDRMIAEVDVFNKGLSNYLRTLSFEYGIQFLWDAYLDQTGNGII